MGITAICGCGRSRERASQKSKFESHPEERLLGKKAAVEEPIEQVGASRRERGFGEAGLGGCVLDGAGVRGGERIFKAGAQAGGVLEEGGQVALLGSDGLAPTGTTETGLELPLQEVNEQDVQPALHFAAITLAQVLDLLGDVVEVGFARRPARKRAALRWVRW